uniref:Uncharacterized protein n=1 Tax=Anguilla anguilla TaxID=7936 RepID=A0A0E9UL58_ANGAN
MRRQDCFLGVGPQIPIYCSAMQRLPHCQKPSWQGPISCYSRFLLTTPGWV